MCGICGGGGGECPALCPCGPGSGCRWTSRGIWLLESTSKGSGPACFNLNTHQVFNMFLSKYSEQLSGAPLLRGQMPSPQQARPSA